MGQRKITITDGTNTVELMKDLEFTIKPENIGAKATMASGKTVMDIVGVKNTLTVPTGWLSNADLQTLKSMIDTTHILSVTYPGIDGDVTNEFLIEQPEYKSFKYSDDGVECWYGITLTMIQQGVD